MTTQRFNEAVRIVQTIADANPNHRHRGYATEDGVDMGCFICQALVWAGKRTDNREGKP